MKFKDSYIRIVQERAYFKNVYKKAQEIVSKLESKLKQLETINSRTKVEVDGVTFTFYKNGVGKDRPLGQYYGNNNIRVYVSNFYGGLDNFNFLRNGIPLKMKRVIVHELMHNEDDSRGVLGKEKIIDPQDDYSGYRNSDTEINARVVEKMTDSLTPYIRQLAKKGEYQRAFRLLMTGIKSTIDLSEYTTEKRQEFIKKLYTTFLGVVDDDDF